MTIGAIDRRGAGGYDRDTREMHGSSPPPLRLRDLVAKPRPTRVRTVLFIALVPLVAFTIFVIATHRSTSPTNAPVGPTPSSRASNVIFVVPVGAPTTKSGE